MSQLSLSLASVLALTAPAMATQTADYRVTDEIRGADVQLAAFPVRPLTFVWRGPGRQTRVWAVNQAEDLVEAFRFNGTSPAGNVAPELSKHVPWNPVSLGYWGNGGAGTDEILVVCRGTWGITRLDATTGEIKGHVTLLPDDFESATDPTAAIGPQGHGRMAEPADILVDEDTDMAFVSCSGADAVVQVDLKTGKIVRIYHASQGKPTIDAEFRCKHPLFLSFGPVPDGGGVRTVYVAPMHSGNNTTLQGPIVTSNPGSIEVAGPANAGDVLPDEDLFEITPWTFAAGGGVVKPKVTGAGTILFGHGLHPTTGEHWCLSTDMNNAGPLNDSEPKVKGRFAESVLTRTQLSASGSVMAGAPSSLESSQTVSERVGQPYALEFGSLGRAYVSGILTDNVVELDQSGGLIRAWSLPDGSIPRGLHFKRVGAIQHLYVYCWGTETILDFDVTSGTGTPALLRTFALTSDPSAAGYRRGREIFFDGHRSETGTLSCATCHVDGGSDMLAWDLSPKPLQDKGPMVTQTLVGLERLGPFHWRGERDFADFNGAFDGLLGNHDPANMNQLSASEFEDFKSFVFSLKNPANPNQNRDRVVDADIHFPFMVPVPSSSALVGQDEFFDVSSINSGQSCNDCHTAPTGTASDLFPIFPAGPVELNPVRRNEKPSALHELWRKSQPLVPDTGPDTTNLPFRPLLGFGFSHGGANFDLHNFLSFVLGASPTPADAPLQRANITDFVFQWDQGIAPAAHFGFFVDGDSVASGDAGRQARNYLGLQFGAASMNCDVVVIGKSFDGTQLVERRWFRDRSGTGQFVCEDSSFSNRGTIAFLNGATDHGESHLFVGYPVGMGERMGFDRDMDGTSDFDDTEDYIVDTSNPSGAGAQVVGTPATLWVNTKHARLAFETDVPTTVVVTYREVGGPDAFTVSTGPTLARQHAPILDKLRPSTGDGGGLPGVMPEDVRFEYELAMTDRAGVTTTDGPFAVLDPLNAQSDVIPTFIRHVDMLSAPADFPGDEFVYLQHQLESTRIVEIAPASGTPGARGFRVDATTTFVRGSDPSSKAIDRAIVGRVIIERCQDVGPAGGPADLECQELFEVPASLIIPGSNSIMKEKVVLTASGTMVSGDLTVPKEPTSQFLVCTDLTDGIIDGVTNHDVSFEFELDASLNLDANDKVYFTIDAVPAVDDWSTTLSMMTATSIEVFVLSRFSYGQWNFARGKEVTAMPFVEVP